MDSIDHSLCYFNGMSNKMVLADQSLIIPKKNVIVLVKSRTLPSVATIP